MDIKTQGFLDGLIKERRVAPKLVWLLDKAQVENLSLKAENENLIQDIFKMNDKCVTIRRKLEAEIERLKEEALKGK